MDKMYGILCEDWHWHSQKTFICMNPFPEDIGNGSLTVPMTKDEAKKHLEALRNAFPKKCYTMFKLKLKENY